MSLFMNTPMLWLTGGVLVLLSVFTAVGQVLKRGAAGEGVENLNARVRSWWAMIALFGCALAFGPIVTLVLFGLISFLALREFTSLTDTRFGDHRSLFLMFFVAVPVQYWLIGVGWYGLFSILIPVYAFLAIPALSALHGDTDNFLTRNATIQWGLMLTTYAISHAAALLLLDIPGYAMPGAMLLLYLMLVVQLSDVFQYVFGKLFGRTKLSPKVSPSKTVEGLVGGGLTAVLAGTGLYFITPFTPLQAAGMSAVIVAGGFLGGLVMSAIKRDLGVKDWGTLIEGHGGVLDRMDSVAFAAPLFFHLTRYWFTP